MEEVINKDLRFCHCGNNTSYSLQFLSIEVVGVEWLLDTLMKAWQSVHVDMEKKPLCYGEARAKPRRNFLFYASFFFLASEKKI